MSGVVNPLVRAANPLLLLSVQLRHSVAAPADVARLREQAVAHAQLRASRAGCRCQHASRHGRARFVLCTMLGEAVNNAPWGDLSGWAQKTLLVTFHGETYGGAQFFQILDRLSVDFSRHLDLIEMMYICLALGFGGRYLVEQAASAVWPTFRTICTAGFAACAKRPLPNWRRTGSSAMTAAIRSCVMCR